MKILSSKAHGILDYLFALFLLASPTLFQMEGNLSVITYALGITHLAITALTDFELGLIKMIPFRIHGLIEVFVSLGLAGLALWFFNDTGNEFGFYYFIILAAVIMLVFILTDFKSAVRSK